MSSRKDLFSFLALITFLVGLFWAIVSITIFLIQSLTLQDNEAIIQAFWFTFNSLVYSWGLCFLPLMMIFGFLSYRNGVIERQEIQHYQQMEAMYELNSNLSQLRGYTAPTPPHGIPIHKPSMITAESNYSPKKDSNPYEPPRHTPVMSPIVVDAPSNSKKHSKYEPEPFSPPTIIGGSDIRFRPRPKTDDQKIAEAARLWKAGKFYDSIRILEEMPHNPKAREILAKMRK